MGIFDRWFKRYSYDNTRRYKRLPAAWPVKYMVVPLAEGPYLLNTKDISAGGVSMISQKMMTPGAMLEMEILITPIKKTIKAVGKILRCIEKRKGEFELGVQFEEIDPEEQVLLDQAIETFYRSKDSAPRRERWWRKLT